MNDPRSDILARVRTALSIRPNADTQPVQAEPGPVDEPGGRLTPSDLVAEFAERWERVGGVFHVAAGPEDLDRILRELLGRFTGQSVSVSASARTLAPGLDDMAADLGLTLSSGDPRTAASASVGLTGAEFGLTYSGTVVVTSDDPDGLVASLLPPVHVALIPKDRFVYSLPEAMQCIGRDDRPRSAVFITGPSRTADIELTLVKGVHGPGAAHAVLLDFA